MKARNILCVCCTLAALTMGCRKEGEGNGHGPTAMAPPAEEKDFNKTKGNPAEGNPTEATMLQTPINADTVFSTRCATCHGQDGKGTGPAAVALNPKPRDYSDPEWQKSVTDEQIKKTIVEGGAAVGKSPLMAPNPDLGNQPAVLDGLVKIVRGFAKS
jgi:mono/diheme cytochrome c family protein